MKFSLLAAYFISSNHPKLWRRGKNFLILSMKSLNRNAFLIVYKEIACFGMKVMSYDEIRLFIKTFFYEKRHSATSCELINNLC